jgi:hypothetical protein
MFTIDELLAMTNAMFETEPILIDYRSDLTDEIIHSLLYDTLEHHKFSLRKGAISCSFKHFLCLKDIVEKKHD